MSGYPAGLMASVRALARGPSPPRACHRAGGAAHPNAAWVRTAGAHTAPAAGDGRPDPQHAAAPPSLSPAFSTLWALIPH